MNKMHCQGKRSSLQFNYEKKGTGLVLLLALNISLRRKRKHEPFRISSIFRVVAAKSLIVVVIKERVIIDCQDT